MPSAIDWHSARDVVKMLRTATAGQGNLLLNIGPKADGSVPDEAVPRLKTVGRWLQGNAEAVYGAVDRTQGRLEGLVTGDFTLKGSTAYFWADRWPGGELALGGLNNQVVRATLLATGEPIAFENNGRRVLLTGLPAENPDPHVGVAVIKLECSAPPSNPLGHGYVAVDNAW
jgi:alpha-L-fucosidase